MIYSGVLFKVQCCDQLVIENWKTLVTWLIQAGYLDSPDWGNTLARLVFFPNLTHF